MRRFVGFARHVWCMIVGHRPAVITHVTMPGLEHAWWRCLRCGEPLGRTEGNPFEAFR